MNHFIKHLCAAALLTAMAGASIAADAVTPADTKAMVTTASGLQYSDVKLGAGAMAKAGGNVSVHYTGWLQNPDGSTGKKFDSSRDRGQPFKFPLGGGQVIRGWDEGVQGMQVGGQRRLVIPAALGYGQRGAAGVIPPGATLIFDVELLGL
ncbi:MAG: FKBP-type peptidyl-prolyl cis-trans isomerase FkpA [Candidatus Paceibacteria bacterium]|jgi:FKBP-type peptidyl-prolyl cis-trans isomerase FkpA